MTERACEPRRIVFAVGGEHEGERLDAVLARRSEVASRSEAQRLIDGGSVLVGSVARSKSYRVAAGDVVEVSAAPVRGATGRPAFEVEMRFADEHLLILVKPAGLVVHHGHGHVGDTLVDLLEADLGPWTDGGDEGWRAGLVHRLDRGTSGLMVVARSGAVRDALQQLVRSRRLVREYLALVDGRLDARAGTIDAPVGRDAADRTRVSIRTHKPRHAVTHFQVERWLDGATLVRARLETGRTHQIRAHFAAIGHPLVGDARYGGPPRSGLDRQFLHAARLSFAHPVTGEFLEESSDLPADLAAVLTREPADDPRRNEP